MLREQVGTAKDLNRKNEEDDRLLAVFFVLYLASCLRFMAGYVFMPLEEIHTGRIQLIKINLHRIFKSFQAFEISSEGGIFCHR